MDLLVLSAGIVPGLLGLFVLYLRRRGAPRSGIDLIRVFVYGALATIPSFIVEQLTGAGLRQPTLLGSAVAGFLLIGPVEELFKFGAVFAAVYRKEQFASPRDGIIFAAAAGLGFASVENAVYLAELGPMGFFSRAVFATPAHVLFAACWGYYLGQARFMREKETRTLVKGLLLAAGVHGLYNFIVAVDPPNAMYTLAPMMVVLAGALYFMSRRVSRSVPVPDLVDSIVVACPQCRLYVDEHAEECPRCGYRLTGFTPDVRWCGSCRAPLRQGASKCCCAAKNARTTDQEQEMVVDVVDTASFSHEDR